MENKKRVEQTDWIYKLKKDVPLFLERMKGKTTPGFFRYSLSGDLFDESHHWGLGNTVFATKIYYTLGLLDSLPESSRQDIIRLIKSFQTPEGTIFDPLVARRAFLREKLSAIKHHDLNNFFHAQTIRAETRQALSTLVLLGEKPNVYPSDLPKTIQRVQHYLEGLDWTKPWGAASHFSHLLFFLAHSELEQKNVLIDVAIEWTNRVQDKQTGCWFHGRTTLQQKINGAMKVITGFKAANRMSIRYPERLIDLALEARNDRQACDHFNVIYVLKYADEATDSSYRHSEIRQFALDRLSQYQRQYWPESGGFSYFLGKANDIYYNAAVSRGLPEPDIHGTVMFLWGIALISQILEIDKQLGFKEFIT